MDHGLMYRLLCTVQVHRSIRFIVMHMCASKVSIQYISEEYDPVYEMLYSVKGKITN